MVKLKMVQKKFARMLPGLEGLDRLGPFSPRVKRLQGDLTRANESTIGIHRVDSKCMIPMVGVFKIK